MLLPVPVGAAKLTPARQLLRSILNHKQLVQMRPDFLRRCSQRLTKILLQLIEDAITYTQWSHDLDR